MQNIITISKPDLSMSSREIAELTGKRHADVMRDVRSMLEQVGEGERNFASAYVDAQGKVRECYKLPKNLTLNLVTGYRADMRLKIIDRWLELEEDKPRNVPTTFREALLLAAEQQEQIELQQAKIASDAPKVAALELISSKEGDLGIRDTGRELKIGQARVREMILARRWACVQGHDIRPAHYGLKFGYVRMVARVYCDRVTGQEKVTDDFKITRKGITRLAEIVSGGSVDE